jgi:hypothetical protein
VDVKEDHYTIQDSDDDDINALDTQDNMSGKTTDDMRECEPETAYDKFNRFHNVKQANLRKLTDKGHTAAASKHTLRRMPVHSAPPGNFHKMLNSTNTLCLQNFGLKQSHHAPGTANVYRCVTWNGHCQPHCCL